MRIMSLDFAALELLKQARQDPDYQTEVQERYQPALNSMESADMVALLATIRSGV